MQTRQVQTDTKVYLIGGGIASLAAAAFLLRDAGMKGSDVVILEASNRIGGSLDANGTPEHGYVMRGGRMIESKYLCTFDLFSSIPALDNTQTVTEEIFAWNRIMKTSSRSRLFRNGKSVNAPAFGLSEGHILTIERLEIEPESLLGRSKISDQFDPTFFQTDFWLMWCTTFAFQPWHSAVEFKRYLLRFTHMVSGFNTLSGIMRTVLNQFDSLVRPLQRWLVERGVQFVLDTKVTDLDITHDASGFSVRGILCQTAGRARAIRLTNSDFVIATLGSMTEASSTGGMDEVPIFRGREPNDCWEFWEKIAERELECGRPGNFSDHVGHSKWISFTTTLFEPTLFDSIRDLTGNAPGEGGLITFPESNWLASIVLPHQPHFTGQPENVNVFWGYGLSVDHPGNFVQKPMADCTGREIMTEIMGHLHLNALTEEVLKTCKCIPCMMPFITSQFLLRSVGDRPDVVPRRSQNLAFVGQFCEVPDDVVFTVEYSIRSAQMAVYSLFGLDRKPPAVYKGNHDPRILLKAFLALHGKADFEALLDS